MGKQFILGTLINVAGPNDPEVDRAWISVQRVEAYAARALTHAESCDLLERFSWDELAGYALTNKQASEVAAKLGRE